MAIDPLAAVGGTAKTSSASGDNLRDVDADDFLKMLITELQNQDPLNPTDNAQILQQISQIRNIQATSQLSQTLESVLLGQNLNSASGLINQHVRGLADSGEEVAGKVERVAIEDGIPKLIVGGNMLKLTGIREIVAGAVD